MPYTPGKGGLLTLIHDKYAFLGNITRIPTPTDISPPNNMNKQPTIKTMANHQHIHAHTLRRYLTHPQHEDHNHQSNYCTHIYLVRRF
jgi:hypothetical protein